MVVTGEPNYPDGVIYKGYENHQKSDEVINGVKVHRCPIIPRRTGIFFRFLNYFSYPLTATHFIKKCYASNDRPYDVVLVNQLSPVLMGAPAIAYKRKFGTPIVMYCLDLWPESLVAGGIKRNSLIYKIFHFISKRIYRAMDRILVTSKMFQTYLLQEFKITTEKIEYLPQYAENIFGKLPSQMQNGKTNFVFAGNVGIAQSVDTILAAAEKLREYPCCFHIVGSGADLGRLKEIARGKKLDNVLFHGRRPLTEMPKFYALADAMLVTLKADPVLSLTLPGKVQSYMAAGRPIVGAIDGETAEVIHAAQCGYCGKAEDVDALVGNLKAFIASPCKRLLGENARYFYKKHFAREKFMDRLEEELMKF